MTWPLVNPVSGYSTLDRLVRTRFRPSTSTATFSGSGLMPLASPAWLRSGDTCPSELPAPNFGRTEAAHHPPPHAGGTTRQNIRSEPFLSEMVSSAGTARASYSWGFCATDDGDGVVAQGRWRMPDGR